MLSLNTIAKNPKNQRKVRIGRGPGSGIGTYSGRGLKGQRSRSGGRGGLKLKGLKATFKGVPKSKGFTSPYDKDTAINISTLEKQYNANDVIRLPNLKILGQGTLSKSLTVYALGFSKTAQEKIEQQGGKAIKCGRPS